MARQKNNRRKMARKKTPRTFARTLTWTVLLALVFSAGLIAGQRALSSADTPALVSYSTPQQTEAAAAADKVKKPAADDVEFSFYDELGDGQSGRSAVEGLKSLLDVSEEDALPARYTLQFGAYPTMDQARKQVSKLKKQGVEAYVTTSKVPKKGKVYRVRIGKFHSMDEARQFQGALDARREIEAFVMPI